MTLELIEEMEIWVLEQAIAKITSTGFIIGVYVSVSLETDLVNAEKQLKGSRIVPCRTSMTIFL
jgi:hypothetical protein